MSKICIYCARELGLNQEYYHKCAAMARAGSDSPLAMPPKRESDKDNKEETNANRTKD